MLSLMLLCTVWRIYRNACTSDTEAVSHIWIPLIGSPFSGCQGHLWTCSTHCPSMLLCNPNKSNGITAHGLELYCAMLGLVPSTLLEILCRFSSVSSLRNWFKRGGGVCFILFLLLPGKKWLSKKMRIELLVSLDAPVKKHSHPFL